MIKLKKITALALALLMSVSALCMTTPVSAAAKYEYNVYANAMVVSVENNAVVLDGTSEAMIAQAKTVGAESIILTAGRSSAITVSISDSMLAQLANGGYTV